VSGIIVCARKKKNNEPIMEVIIRPDKESATYLCAKIISDSIVKRPHIVLGLATGRTMECLYPKLAGMHKDNGLDFSLAKTFNLDEYVGLPPEDKNSYRYYMNAHLFRKINIDIRNTFLPDGLAVNLDEECKRYEQRMKEFGGINLQLLGIGSDGHIGFNEPLSSLRSRTRVKALTLATIKQNSPLFDSSSQMPRRAITMGVGTILEAEKIVVLVVGDSKAEILAKAVEGPITSMVTASVLQLHPKCVVIADEEAAEKLKGKEYYKWIFDNEPEWEAYRS
jgi:glucosamine-6-phosphate deaminase